MSKYAAIAKDAFGNDLCEGDFVVYSPSSKNIPGLRIGQVRGVVSVPTYYYERDEGGKFRKIVESEDYLSLYILKEYYNWGTDKGTDLKRQGFKIKPDRTFRVPGEYQHEHIEKLLELSNGR